MTRRSPALDLVRAVCIIGVVTTHFVGNFVPRRRWNSQLIDISELGSFGVTGFFLLSSYLLTKILLKEVARGQRRIWKRYLTRRALRIWPLYFSMVAVATVLAALVASGISSAGWLATFTYNWVSWSRPTASWLGHFWSVCAEEQLYFVIPLLSFAPFRIRWKALACIALIGPVARFYTVHHYVYPAVWNFTTSHLDTFSIGMLLASLDFEGPPRWRAIREWLGKSGWAAMVGSVILLVLVAGALSSPVDLFASSEAVVSYLAATLIFVWLLLALTERDTGTGQRGYGCLQWVGQRSYGAPRVAVGTGDPRLVPGVRSRLRFL